MRSMLLSLLVVGAPLAAQTANPFSDLTQATRASFPDKVHYGVICDYGFSHTEVQKLAEAMGSGHITVVDIKSRDQVGGATQVLRRAGTELMVLLPKDRLVRDGAPHATLAVMQLGERIPVVGTQARALDNGAAFAIGEGTGHELLVNKNLRGIIGPITASSKSARAGGSAQVSVVRAR